MSYLDMYHDELTEIITRRNIMVHNRGIVNNTYLSKVNDKYTKDIKLRDCLSVNREYIDRAMTVIEIVGYLVLIDIMLKVSRKGEDTIEMIESIAYSILCDEKWEVALEIYSLLYKVKGISAKDKLIYRINYWQCYKWLNRYEEIKKEVDETDLSAHTSMFRLCAHIIKDEYEEFFNLLKRDYDNLKELIDLDTWPIFRNIREREEYKNFVESIKEVPLLA